MIILMAGVIIFAACTRKRLAPRPYVAYVACHASQTIAAVDLSAFRTVASIQVGFQPFRVLARPRTHEIFAFSSGGRISVIEFPSEKVVREFSAGPSCLDPWFSNDGSALFLLDAAAGRIVVVDAAGGKIRSEMDLSPGLADLALTPDGKTLIASNALNNRLYFADAQSRKVLGSVQAGKGPGPLAVLPDSSKVFVADTDDDKISAVNIETRSLISNIEIGSKPSRLALKPDGGELFAFSSAASTMTIIDTSQDDVEQNFPTGRGVGGAVFRSDSLTLYMATAGDSFASFFDVNNRRVTSAIRVSVSPGPLALTPDQRFLVVGSEAAGSLDVLETNPAALLTTLPVGADPVDLIIPGWVLKK